MPNLSDNLEDLLIYDDVFYDYFNSFLSLPVWLSFQIFEIYYFWKKKIF